MRLISKLLRKNTSGARIAGFILSNFIGLAIIGAGLQFYLDARSIWDSDDSFIKTDYLVVNKKVTSANTLGEKGSGFTAAELDELKAQPWVRDVGAFSAADYRIWASVDQGGRGMSTMLFFESIPAKFVDTGGAAFSFRPGEREVPIIISKDYLALYNFGFAGSAGLPQMSESLMSGIPLSLELAGYSGGRRIGMTGRVVGYSSRLNTILVPQEFIDWSNAELGRGGEKSPSRLIIDVSRPGDTAIKEYLDSHDLEVAGDKRNSQASFLLRVVVGIVLGIGVVITLLSLFILLLSVSLLMEKNRDKLHGLLMLGYSFGAVSRYYEVLVAGASATATVLAVVGVEVLRASYVGALRGVGGEGGNVWLAPLAVLTLGCLVAAVNIIAVRRKVASSFSM